MAGPSRAGEIIEVNTPAGEKKRYKIEETPVDPPNSIKRRLVPVETTEEDIPANSRLLDERETEGVLARSTKTEKFLIGELVRMKTKVGDPMSDVRGTIEAMLKGGRLRVRWNNGTVDRYEAKDLTHIW